MTSGCPQPSPGSEEAATLDQARQLAKFTIVYPCDLPAGEKLSSSTVDGPAGKQKAEMIFSGPFDLSVRQAQVAPAAAADPVGASRTTEYIASNIPATFIQRNDGSSKALYHLLWQKDDFYYEVQVVGPPLQQRAVLAIARSLR